MAKVLLVYFSRSGTTQKLAQWIAHETGWDLDPIVEDQDRRGLRGYMRSARDSWNEHRVEVAAPKKDPSDYELVVIGTPVWVAGVSSPVRSYLLDHAEVLRRVAFFATMGGRGSKRAFRQMEQLARKQPLATLAVTESQVARGAYRAPMERFIAQLSDVLAGYGAPVDTASPPQLHRYPA